MTKEELAGAMEGDVVFVVTDLEQKRHDAGMVKPPPGKLQYQGIAGAVMQDVGRGISEPFVTIRFPGDPTGGSGYLWYAPELEYGSLECDIELADASMSFV